VRSLIVFAGLLAVTFIGSKTLFKQDRSRSPMAYLLFSGTAFLLMGIFISPNGLDLIPVSVLKQLRPLVYFGLGWVGFLYGFQLEWRYLRRIPSAWYITATGLFLLPAMGLLAGAWGVAVGLQHIQLISPDWILPLSGIAAILLAESCTAFVFWANRRYRFSGRHYRLACFVAAIDNFFPISCAALLFLFFPLKTMGLSPIPALMVEAMMGVAAGHVLHYLVRRVSDPLDVSTILFGAVFTLSGAAYLFHFSPLFVAMMAGLTFTNRTRRHSWFQQRLTPVEKPLYLMFMIVLPLYGFESGWAPLAAAIVLVTIKYLTKRMTLFATRRLHQAPGDFSRRGAFLLLPMSGIGPALLLEIRERFPAEWIGWASAILIFALLLGDWAGAAGVYQAARKKAK